MSSRPAQPFAVSLEDLGLVAIVRVQGEVDTATAPQMGQVVEAQLARGSRVVLDLSRVKFMDLHGLAVLLRASRRVRAEGGSFALERPPPCVVRLFDLVRMNGEIDILPEGPDPPSAA